MMTANLGNRKAPARPEERSLGIMSVGKKPTRRGAGRAEGPCLLVQRWLHQSSTTVFDTQMRQGRLKSTKQV